jgi:glucan phosphoethanolaminetransferase (alkaline phosphatase superfamily)
LPAVALLVLLLMTPNVIWLMYSHAPSTFAAAIVLPTILLTTLFAILGRWLWAACLLLAPFAMLVPLEIFYVATYHTPSTAQVIATVLITNPQETVAYLGSLLPILLIAPVLSLSIAVVAAWLAFRANLRWNGRTREWIAAIAVATPIVSIAIGLAMSRGSLLSRLQTAVTPLRSIGATIQSGYPFGLFQRFGEYRHEWTTMRTEARKFQTFSYHARRAATQPRQRQVYVLVIGESSAREHWQLFGYDRPTNPELSKLDNLIPIGRMVTSWPDTLAAVPVMLTRKPYTSNRPQWKEPSFLPAMQEAGYETWWISNQYPIGKFDSPVSIYAYEAQHVVWLNHTATWDNPGSYDGELVRPLREALRTSHHDLFIVLHMMGSHMYYDYRYPPSFARFKPVESDRQSTVVQGLRIRNSYDNTIVYTDHVLAQIIDVLKQSGAVSAVWYESDHGEVLPSPGCDREGHGIGTWHEFEIPALFWYSDAYQRDFPRRVAALRANADKRSLSADTFESLIDMAGVTFPGHDETWSLFSQDWRYRPRIVAQFWYTDFDHASFGKGCGVVMPDNSQPDQRRLF